MSTVLSPVLDVSGHAAELNELMSQLPQVPRQDLDTFFAVAAKLCTQLPGSMLEMLRAFQAQGNQDGYLLIRGLPVQSELPPTPTSTPAPTDRPLITGEAWLVLFGSVLGLPTGYRELRSGTLYHDVY